MTEELWKEYLPGYEVSNFGQIRNKKSNRILKQHVLKSGYCACTVSLGSRKRKKSVRIHVAVAKLFIDNPDELPMVNHIDGNKTNNHVDNLEWCTGSYNMKHAIRMGLKRITYGEENGASKLKKEDVVFIKQSYVPRDKEFGARALAKRYNVDHACISQIIHGKNMERYSVSYINA